MLSPNDIDYLARKARYDDLIKEAEQARLVNEIEATNRSNKQTYRKLIGQLGSQMIHLGEKLEDYGTQSAGTNDAQQKLA